MMSLAKDVYNSEELHGGRPSPVAQLVLSVFTLESESRTGLHYLCARVPTPRSDGSLQNTQSARPLEHL